MEAFIFILEIIGTVAFAISGAMTGLKKKMDIFGVVILALTTAVGGGVIRDVILGITPPITFKNPVYAMIAIIIAIIIFIPAIRKLFMHNQIVYSKVIFIMDTLGLGIFTVMGISSAYNVSVNFNGYLLVFVGVVTGVGGGVLRDVLAGITPYIFVKHIYACASIVGAVVCVLLWKEIGSTYSMLAGLSLIVLIRVLSARGKWNLPIARDID